MKKVNTYGMTMKGLRKAASETKGLKGYYSGHYVQISYDKSDGEVLTNYHYNLGQNSWTEYHDQDIITIGNYSSPATMQEIADKIAETVDFDNMTSKLYEEEIKRNRECCL
jgi:hypothetical protein